jgi:uncharacterized protein YyaL (SSP411 family)
MQIPGSRPRAAGALAFAAACSLGASAAREPLPGAAPHAPELAARLEQAAATRAAGSPRTRHRTADGSPRYVNRLALEASPYLLQHAHNPVDWYAWGDEAFARAERERKPVFVSIGYSTCHWCHVMEEESFEDLEIAAFLNRHFVAIKVDRERRPDVDAVYMAAARGLGVAGGWPLNVWLLPDRRPFYAGTYFPPRAGARGARTGFLELLERLRAVYRDEPGRVEQLGAGLARELASASSLPAGAGAPDAQALARAVRRLRADFDAVHGGFGAAPKFPRSLELELLLRYHRRTGDAQALEMVERTLAALAAGGIRDHVGGGFHRYATDAAWRTPHFEKMLYDNALLARVHLDAYQVTGREGYARVAREILDYLAADLLAPAGGFHSASDADSEGIEGRYFTWTAEEIGRAVPDARQARLLCAYYGVGPGGTGGRSVLAVARPLAAVAAELGIPEDEATDLLEDGRAGLLRARRERVPPHTDRKIVAAWNGLAISAFARAALVLREPAYAAAATRAAELIRERLGSPSLAGSGVRLRRALFDGRADGDGFLDDHAFVAAGALDLFEVSRDPAWLRFALSLQAELDARFWDDASGGYFFTADDQERLLARQKPAADAAEPSGNSAAVSNLLRLHELTGDERFRERAERSLRAFAAAIERDPAGSPGLLAALDFATDRVKEIAIVTPAPEVEPDALLAVLARSFVPNRVLAVVSEGDALRRLAPLVPLVAGRVAREGRPTAYVCERRVCAFPTADPEVFAGQLATAAPLPGAAETATDASGSGPRSAR